MNTCEALIELTESEQVAVIGGDENYVAGAAGAAGGVSGGAAVSAVIGQWGEMAAAGYAMTWGEASYVAASAATAPATIIAAGVAVDVYLVGQAATEGYGAFQSLGSLANQYQSYGESTASSWFHAIFDGLSGFFGSD